MDRLPQDREGPLDHQGHQRGRPDRRQADRRRHDHRREVQRGRAHPAQPGRTARRNCSTRSPPGRSPARRTPGPHTDLWDFDANLAGSKAAVQSLRPVLEERDPELVKTLDEKFTAAETELGTHQAGDGWRLHNELSKDELKRLSDVINALAEPISKIAPIVAQQMISRRKVFGLGARRCRGRRARACSPPALEPTSRQPSEPQPTTPTLLRRAPGGHRHPRPGPAALRRVRRHHRPTGPSCAELLQEWTAAAARLTQGQEAGAFGAVGGAARPRPTTRARRSACPPRA